MAEGNPKLDDEHSEATKTKPHNRIHILPSITHCHSCNASQTLTDLQTLDSQWRLVLLCVSCLRLVRSGATCSYCFADVTSGSSLDCRRCSCRVHVSCVRSQRRLFSPSDLDAASFVCMDCCPVLSLHSKSPSFSFSGTMRSKGLAAVGPVEKAREQKRPLEEAKPLNDEELALQLHLAINGSRRISRSSFRNMRSDSSSRICENIGQKEGIPYVESKKEGSVTTEIGTSGVCEDSGNSTQEWRNGGSLLKYYRRRAKKINNSEDLKNGGEHRLNRYLMKYRRKSALKAIVKEEEEKLASSCRQHSCSNTSTLSDLSSMPGCLS